jgi:galactofuranose transport system substrate-binding protein
MTPVRRSLTLAALALSAAWLTGCAEQAPEGQRIVLGFAQIGEVGEWRQANSASIKSAAETSNIELHLASADGSQEYQIASIRSFIAQKVDLIAFSPVVETGWDEVLREAKAADIPVILTDRSVTAHPDLYLGFLGSDFVEEGRKAARLVLEKFRATPGDIRIVELQGTVGSGPAIDRQKGFAEIIASQPRFKIVHSQSGDFSRARGREAMESVLAGGTRAFHALYAHNDDMALGAIEALEAAGMKPGKEVYIVSIDAVRSAFQAMVAGKLNATIECNPLLGPQLMTSVTEVMAGRPIPKRMYVDEAVFTEETAAQFIQARKY